MILKRLKLIWYVIRFRAAAINELFDDALGIDEFYRARDAFKPTPVPEPQRFRLILIDDRNEIE